MNDIKIADKFIREHLSNSSFIKDLLALRYEEMSHSDRWSAVFDLYNAYYPNLKIDGIETALTYWLEM